MYKANRQKCPTQPAPFYTAPTQQGHAEAAVAVASCMGHIIQNDSSCKAQ